MNFGLAKFQSIFKIYQISGILRGNLVIFERFEHPNSEHPNSEQHFASVFIEARLSAGKISEVTSRQIIPPY